MPQSQMPYGDRMAAVRCQILQNRTTAVRSPYDFYGHRTVAVAFFYTSYDASGGFNAS